MRRRCGRGSRSGTTALVRSNVPLYSSQLYQHIIIKQSHQSESRQSHAGLFNIRRRPADRRWPQSRTEVRAESVGVGGSGWRWAQQKLRRLRSSHGSSVARSHTRRPLTARSGTTASAVHREPKHSAHRCDLRIYMAQAVLVMADPFVSGSGTGGTLIARSATK